MTKTAIITALLKSGEIVEFAQDVTDSWNEAASQVDPEMLALGFGMAETEESLVDIAARHSGFVERADFLEFRRAEVV